MVKGTIMSFVVAVVLMLVYLISWNTVFAVLSIFMALFGGILVLFDMKDKSKYDVEDVEDDDDETAEEDIA